LAEAELFPHIRHLLGCCSAILIIHHFSTVQMADCIYVMEQTNWIYVLEKGQVFALIYSFPPGSRQMSSIRH
jgi:ABC-type multidrug transport system fused ATPase/permease subunit